MGIPNIYQRLADRSHNQTAAFMNATVAHVTRMTSGNPSTLTTLNCPLQVAENDRLRMVLFRVASPECRKRDRR